jgi:integrase/recombinase XerD
MIQMMEQQTYAPSTIKCYVHWVKELALYYGTCPSVLSDQQIGDYLQTIRDRGCCWSTVNAGFSGIKWFYIHILERTWNFRKLARPRREKRLPEVLSKPEVRRLIESVRNLKHRTALMVMYSAGMRVGEVVKLKVNDIDLDRMLIRVEQAKGKKDRYTILSPAALLSLRAYWKDYRPRGPWLFESADRKSHWSIRSLQQVFKRAIAKAGIQKAVSSHVLRHSFATHLLEQGVDTLIIKDLLGHSQLQTTAKYLHVRKTRLGSLENPLDSLFR